ncbi:MAG: phage tail tip lysozyme, partial [Candidatus Microsaccharimonas sp.]
MKKLQFKERTKQAFIIAMALVFALTILPLPNASAQVANCDEDFYNSNDILFYNPCLDAACSSDNDRITTEITKVHGANNGEKIYNFWIDAGLATQQAAGVTGSMKHEGGFSPFRQEMSKTWPDGGYGIAQFTWDPGQRGDVKAYLTSTLGADVFNQYYKAEYGGGTIESNGYKPDGITDEINDKFLLGELNFLLTHIKGLVPNNVRWDSYNRDWGVTIDPSINLYDYLKTIETPGDAAKAWTYLYEFPGDIKSTSSVRAASAEEIFTLYTGDPEAGATCGTLTDGGMNLDQAKAFMEIYKKIDDGDPNGDRQYLSGACDTLTDNCVTFSSYFIRKYTTINFVSNDGGKVVQSTLAGNPELESGTVPKAYAMFGT